MFSPLVPWLAKIHQESLLAEAWGNQMVVRNRPEQARLAVRVLVGLGMFLISMGLDLHERYMPEMQPAPESCCPALR